MPTQDEATMMGVDADFSKIRTFIKKRLSEINSYESEGLHFLGKFNSNDIKKLIEEEELHNQIWLDNDGSLYVFGIPTKAHDAVGCIVQDSITRWTYEVRLDSSKYRLTRGGHFIGNAIKVPDFAIVDNNFNGKSSDSHRNPFPVFVCEVAIKNESFPILQKEMDLWLSDDTSVLSVLGFKIFGLKVDKTRRMVMLFHTRDGLREQLEFGDDLANPPNFFEINTKYVIPSLGDIQNFVKIDLLRIRNDVNSFLRY